MTKTIRHNWKREAETWRNLAHLTGMALAAVAEDKTYECRCGDPPYVDGNMCPACFAIYAVHELKALWQQGNELDRARAAQAAGGAADTI